jgi:O-antigen/teichoic acid export membrane protein
MTGEMRSRKAFLNIASSLGIQVVSIISGFIIPKMILVTFGSQVNGVTASISQFLGYIVLLEAGVGGVERAALYKPLVSKETVRISQIIKAADKFFRLLALFFAFYSLIIALLYPLLVQQTFDYWFTFSLILIMGAATFFQYYFGITYQILLQADQRGYIIYSLQILTSLINIAVVVLLVKLGAGVHAVKLGSAAIYIIRPLLIYYYVRKRYHINWACPVDNSVIKQRWDGFGHHLAFFLHTNTDIVVLTLLTTVKEVSVYSVYYMIVAGIERLTSTFSSGLEAAFGNMIARNEKKALSKNFQLYEFMSFNITSVLFTTTSIMIVPFVSIYTKGITDADYYRPMFAYILTAAQALYCIRIPYHAVVLAAGHFKQTRNGAFMEACINIFLSFALVHSLGLVGVVIGTLCAMLFRTLQYAMYLSKHILLRRIGIFYKRFMLSVFTSFLIIVICYLLPNRRIETYTSWFLWGAVIGAIAVTVTLLINVIFYRDNIRSFLKLLKKLVSSAGTNRE